MTQIAAETDLGNDDVAVEVLVKGFHLGRISLQPHEAMLLGMVQPVAGSSRPNESL